MHKSIKTFAENEGKQISRKQIGSIQSIFSAKYIRLAQLFDSEITDIRGFFFSSVYFKNQTSRPLSLFFFLFCMNVFGD